MALMSATFPVRNSQPGPTSKASANAFILVGVSFSGSTDMEIKKRSRPTAPSNLSSSCAIFAVVSGQRSWQLVDEADHHDLAFDHVVIEIQHSPVLVDHGQVGEVVRSPPV